MCGKKCANDCRKKFGGAKKIITFAENIIHKPMNVSFADKKLEQCSGVEIIEITNYHGK